MQDYRFAEHLAAFVAAARAGSFSAAARARGSTPSSVTRQIDALEEHLGAALFIRSTRMVRLTEAGRLLLDRASPILDALVDLRAEIASLDGAVSGTFRVACQPTLGKRCVIPASERLMRSHPGLRVEVDFTERLADPVSDRMDAVIRVGALTDSSLIATKLGVQRMLMCASPDYLKQAALPFCKATLAQHRLLDKLHGDDLLGWREALAAERSEIDRHVVFRCDDFEALRDAACRGLGIARLASWIVWSDVERGRLVPIPARLTKSGEQGIFALRSLPKPSATYRAFVVALKQELASEKWDQALRAAVGRETK
ncbi:LysR family transcriptional regulator [Bradyrhizobium sp. ARR65]|uniref:LysR family transcriptional regulator n=1 Tax=Bradyrhizobium sp. ARR65 TaxID=1040989 RepID=UPI000467818A|nr:LysR family transcriptional regulator [Bradyrhizobium sp. ARR65]